MANPVKKGGYILRKSKSKSRSKSKSSRRTIKYYSKRKTYAMSKTKSIRTLK